MAADQEIQQQIERYIRGELPPGAEDELWAGFLEDPKWFDYFMIELHLVSLSESEKQRRQT